MKNFTYLIFILTLISCAVEKEKTTNDKQLWGTWKNETLKVKMPLDDKDSTLVAKKGKWEEVLGIKPILTTFNMDSTFKSEYYTLDDQLFHTAMGKWWIRNDSLVMLSEEGETVYYFKQTSNRIEFSANLDWNVDGRIDSYQGTQIKVE